MSEQERTEAQLPRRHFTPKRLDEETMCLVGGLYSGRVLMSLTRAMAFSAPPGRDTLLALRKDFELSRGQLAALLGVMEPTLKAWETGRRSPSRAAQRCIWFLDNLLRENKLTDLVHLVTWNQFPLSSFAMQPTQDIRPTACDGSV